MKKAKTVSIVGAPFSGKSTLSSQINSILKTQGQNSIFVEEYVVEYIAEYGIPTTMEQQQIIFQEQFRKERMFAESKDFIVCDSASWLSYIYGRQYYSFPLGRHAIASLSHMHKKSLESLEYWDYVFYVPLLEDYNLDGVRFHDKDEAEKIDKMIKGWLEIEQIPYIDLSNVSLDDRINVVMEHILVPGEETEEI